MKQNHHPHPTSHHSRTTSEKLWPRIVIRKWLNRSSRNTEYTADSEEDDDDVTYATQDESYGWPKESRFKDNKQGDDLQGDPNGNTF